MKLIIDGSGGFAGDMFTASLIDAGADFHRVRENMEKCGSKLGRIRIGSQRSRDNALRLSVSLEAQQDHIAAHRVKSILTESFEEINTPQLYREFGLKVLEILIHAEEKAHKQQVFEKLMHHHGHSHHGPVLHEAQDIIVDIIGAVTGLEMLDISPSAALAGPLRTGSGTVEFSHGILDVPAPATRVILKKYGLDWEKGPVDTELCTPTGASILAALVDRPRESIPASSLVRGTGSSRGTKDLPIPPLKIFLIQ